MLRFQQFCVIQLVKLNQLLFSLNVHIWCFSLISLLRSKLKDHNVPCMRTEWVSKSNLQMSNEETLGLIRILHHSSDAEPNTDVEKQDKCLRKALKTHPGWLCQHRNQRAFKTRSVTGCLPDCLALKTCPHIKPLIKSESKALSATKTHSGRWNTNKIGAELTGQDAVVCLHLKDSRNSLEDSRVHRVHGEDSWCEKWAFETKWKMLWHRCCCRLIWVDCFCKPKPFWSPMQNFIPDESSGGAAGPTCRLDVTEWGQVARMPTATEVYYN